MQKLIINRPIIRGLVLHGTQNELARKLNMSTTALSKRLTGKIEWRMGELNRLAEALNVDVLELIKVVQVEEM